MLEFSGVGIALATYHEEVHRWDVYQLRLFREKALRSSLRSILDIFAFLDLFDESFKNH